MYAKFYMAKKQIEVEKYIIIIVAIIIITKWI